MTEFLQRELDQKMSRTHLQTRVAEADGSIGRALAGDTREDAAEAVERLLAAVREGPGARAVASLAQQPWRARGEFTTMLDALAVQLRDEVIESSDAVQSRGTVAALDAVARARELAQNNVNPQLILAELTEQLAGVR